MRLFQILRGPINVMGPLRRPYRLTAKGPKLQSPFRPKGRRGFRIKAQNPVHIRGPRFFDSR